MRNEWYPRQKAEYVTTANLHGVKPQAIVAERDFRFGLNSKEEEVSRPGEEQVTTAAQKGEPGEVPVKRISVSHSPGFLDSIRGSHRLQPKRTTELIEALVPNPILFYKTPIQEPEPQPEDSPSRPRRATSGAAADLDAASKPLTKPAEKQLTTIFGAVSTADIAESIRGLLATTEEAARVTLGADDIKILQQESKGSEYQATGIEGDRLKALGDFEVEVRVKGGSPVKRTVSVQAQEIAPEQ